MELNKNAMRANIHTMEIETTENVNVTKLLSQYELTDSVTAKRVDDCIKTLNNRFGRGDKKGKRFILNLNKFYGADTYYFSEFMETLQTIEGVLNLKDKYKITRCDLKFDSTDPTFYERNKKIIRLLMSVIAYGTDTKNVYRAEDGLTLEQRSFRVLSNNWDIEYYNKRIESDGKDPSNARFELRLINHSNGIKNLREAFDIRLSDFYIHMCDDDYKIDLLPVTARYNSALLREWKEGHYSSIRQFIEQRAVQEVIFTRTQMIGLLEKIVKENPKEKSISNYQKWIDNYFSRHEKIEFTNQRQLTAFWNDLIGAKYIYFGN